jgi:hypothetical protein
MVATERIRRSEAEQDLSDARIEREALRSALRLLEEENGRLRGVDISAGAGARLSHSRSSSEIALKSPPQSPSAIPLPSSNRSSLSATLSASTSIPGDDTSPAVPAFPPASDLTPTAHDRAPTHPDADLVLNPFARVQAPTPPVPLAASAPAAPARPPLLSRVSSSLAQLAASRPASPSIALPSLPLSALFPDADAEEGEGSDPWAGARSMSPRPAGTVSAAFGRGPGSRRAAARSRSVSRSTTASEGSRKSFEGARNAEGGHGGAA